MKNFFYFISLAILLSGCRACNTASKMVDNGYNTVYKEFKPEELLRKYEWFKDASAQCEQKRATLLSYEARFADMKQMYGADSTKRAKWNRADVEQWSVWQSEYLGLKASYNGLSADYNAAMSKFNYAFCNAGSMPDGSMTPLPREFKPYITN